MEDNSKLDIDWAYVVDLFASEYGWTIDYIQTLNLGQIYSLIYAMKKRYEKQNQQANSDDVIPSGNISSDNSELKISDFETKMGGKRRVREDGTVEIVV